MRPTKNITKVNKTDQEQINRFSYFIDKYVAKNQIEAAKALGLTQAYYSYMVSGKRKISLTALMTLKTKFKLNIEWLQSGVGKELLAEDLSKKQQTAVGKIIDLQASIDQAETKITILEVNLNQAYKLIDALERRLEKAGL